MSGLAPVDVPCGDCRLCCRRTTAVLLPERGDDPARFETQPLNDGSLRLKMQPNDDCVYLTEHGCSIHDRAPFMCRVCDCRNQHAMYTRRQRREMLRAGLLDKAVLRRGWQLREMAKS